MAPLGIGTYTSCALARLSCAVTIFMWLPSILSKSAENKMRCLSIHIRPEAFGSHGRGSPPNTDTTHVSQLLCESPVVYAMRDKSGENTGLIFASPSFVS